MLYIVSKSLKHPSKDACKIALETIHGLDVSGINFWSMLGQLLDPFLRPKTKFRDPFLDRFWAILETFWAPGSGTIAEKIASIAGKSASWGGPGRPGNVAFICCPSWLRHGAPLNQSWDHLGTILAPKMAPKSDLGPIWAPKKQIWAPKMVPIRPQQEGPKTPQFTFYRNCNGTKLGKSCDTCLLHPAVSVSVSTPVTGSTWKTENYAVSLRPCITQATKSKN